MVKMDAIGHTEGSMAERKLNGNEIGIRDEEIRQAQTYPPSHILQ